LANHPANGRLDPLDVEGLEQVADPNEVWEPLLEVRRSDARHEDQPSKLIRAVLHDRFEDLRLANQLRGETAASVFTETGALSPQVISGSHEAINGSKFGNQALVGELTKDGSNIADWGKYTTETFASPAGDFQVHYYYNSKTGAAFYDYDFKAVFNHQGGW
jgi:hypothetical protein